MSEINFVVFSYITKQEVVVRGDKEELYHLFLQQIPVK